MTQLHLDPAADWMAPDAFVVGGAIDQRTEHLRRAHGARCLTLWRESVHRFANGRPVTYTIIEAHNRQSLDHWCLARAAAYAVLERQPPTSPRGLVPRTPSQASMSQPSARPLLWGRR